MKTLTYIFLTVLLYAMIASCVPQRKLIYLQKEKGAPRHSDFYYDSSPHQLKPDDVIGVNVFSLTPAEFNFFGASRSFDVEKDGMVELPALGYVKVEGLTIEETEDTLKALLQDYLKSPLVDVQLQTPIEYTMLGEVNGVGTYTYIGEELSIMRAIADAGDLSQFADRANLRIIRDEEGERRTYYVNLLDEELMGDEFYYIRSGDLIIADPLPAKSASAAQGFVLGLVGSVAGIFLLFANFQRFF